MQLRHIPPIIIMMISGMIAIRLALSPVAVTSTTCTEDHPYYLSNCDEPDWTATPVTVYPTASENDMPDTDPPVQIPSQTATPTATIANNDQLDGTPLIGSQQSNNTSITLTPTLTPTTTRVPFNTPVIAEQLIDQPSSSEVICQPKTRLIIKGTTDPYSLLLLTFDNRVVGGGISYTSGSYAIPLVVGTEARGIYTIEVRQRNTNKVIKQLSCTVP